MPSGVQRIADLLGALEVEPVELRVMPPLRPLADGWTASRHASGFRSRNAHDR